jgi:hypothetical protein
MFMVILPLSPIACAVLTTFTLIVTFYVGKWCGVKKVMDCMMKEIEKND